MRGGGRLSIWSKNTIKKFISAILTVALLLSLPVPLMLKAETADVTFSSGAVLIDSTYNGKNIHIQNGVFSVTVSGAENVNILFEDVVIDRRYTSDTSSAGLNGQYIENLYETSSALGWISNGNLIAPVCPLMITNNSSVSVAFRGTNELYAGTNWSTVSTSGVYTAKKGGGGFAGIQVDSGSTLTIVASQGTVSAYGAFYVEGDNSENSSYGYNSPDGSTQNQLAGGAGIGGGVSYNTSTSASQYYTSGTPGTIIINGGIINAYGGHEAAGIGGGLNSAATSSSIIINGGTVNAYGGRWAAGIGDGDSLQNDWSGSFTDSYSIVINGGTVSAVGGVGCPGIGATDELSAGQTRKDTSGMEIHINGGRVSAKSGYPDGFDSSGSNGYSGTDAAAAIGAGNRTSLASNSISISSSSQIIASGFGHYSVTENGTDYSARPTVNIDSDGYMFLARFPTLSSSKNRTFHLYEAQRYDIEVDGRVHQFIKYMTQTTDGSAGKIYYFSSTGILLDENLQQVEPPDGQTTEQYVNSVHLTLYVDSDSVKIGEVSVLAHFRSVAITLPDPADHGGIYALTVPTDAVEVSGVVLPSSGFVVATIGAQEQGIISGILEYPQQNNVTLDEVTESFTDLDVYIDGAYSDGSPGLIGDRFSENSFAYTVYIESSDDTAYIYAAFLQEENTSYDITADGVRTTVNYDGSKGWINYTVDMSGLTRRVVRIRKCDTVNGHVTNPIVYKITIIKKPSYRIELKELSKVYDGTAVSPEVKDILTESGERYSATADELSSVTFAYYYLTDSMTWMGIGTSAPKNAGQYMVVANITADTYNATCTEAFVISKRTVTVIGIENNLTYILSSEVGSWTAPHIIDNPGQLILSGLIRGDDVTASAASVYYNDVSIGYSSSKITLEGVSLVGSDMGNYTTADLQYVFGQISYSLDGTIFRKSPLESWDKFYPVDSLYPVGKGTDPDYRSPLSESGFYDSHCDYVYARTVGEGDGGAKYAVDIEYGAMYFSFLKTQWDVSELRYTEFDLENSWTGFDGVNNRITVINRSNAPVLYTPGCSIDFLHSAIGNSDSGIKGKITLVNSSYGNSVTGIPQVVDAAIPGNIRRNGTSTRSDCYLILSGIPQFDESDSYISVGSVSVTISRVYRQ